LGRFSGGILKGNRSEVLPTAGESAAGTALHDVLKPGVDDAAVGAALNQLASKTTRAAFCTMGERGILVARPGQDLSLVPACPVNGPIDIVGAGDAATSGIVTALLSGTSELEAAAFGNLIASITIQQLGTTGTATPEQVRERWQQIGKAAL
jgi:sugar/nucleoside kinase (ribokinase family)